MFDEVIVAIGHNGRKQRMLPLDGRLQVLRDSTGDIPGVRVDQFEGLLVEYCRRIGATAIVRGLRAVTDFEFELQAGLANMNMAPEVQTVFFLAEPHHIFVSSSLIREIVQNGGDASRYLPPAAWVAMQEAMKRGGL